MPHVKAGKLILLNINGTHAASRIFPEVPTLTELGITGADVPIWFSIFAPSGTPKDIVAKLNARMIEIAKSEDMKAKMLRNQRRRAAADTRRDGQAPCARTSRSNAELITAANIKIE